MAQSFLSSQTGEDFYKAHNKALLNEVQHFLNPEATNLVSFTDVKKLLKPRNEVYQGMQTVKIDLIVGSEGRYQDFDNHFFPKSTFLKKRWEHVDEAHIQDIPLPPISLYELGGLYFVRDGNHRVSVAKARGVEYIDADVISLKSEIHLKPSSTKNQMIKQVLSYEKREFYNETNFGDITDDWCLDFSTPGQYDVIYTHIETHRYYINQNKTEPITFEDAILSWHTNVYVPVVKAIEKYRLMKKFKGRTKPDLYIYLVKYWDELKQKFGNDLSLDKATKDFKHNLPSAKIFKRIKNLFEKIMLRSSQKENVSKK